MEITPGFLGLLNSLNLKLEEYVYLWIRHRNMPYSPFILYNSPSDLFDSCVSKKLIDPDNNTLTDKALRILGLEVMTSDWVEQWRELFPKGYKQGSIPLRGDKPSIEKKFKKFFRTYDFTQEEIIQATKRYLKEQEESGYAYCKVAQYLIEKDGTSVLASLCEAYRESPTTTTSDVWMKKA